jgi:hypothetical protein
MQHSSTRRSPRRIPRLGPLLGVCLLGTVTAPATQAQDSGSLAGVVFDSTSMAPLVNADVILWNTSHRTRTESAGIFSFPDLPPGTYTVNFFHPRLAELGLSAGSWNVAVEAGEETLVELATPSMPNVLLSGCILEDPSGDWGRVVGQVQDPATGMPVEGAMVRLIWGGTPGDPKEASGATVMADEYGWFRSCLVPGNESIGVIAIAGSRQSRRREFAVSPGGGAVVPLGVGMISNSSIAGRITDVDGGAAIEAAEVSLLGSPHRTLSREDGSFSMKGVHPGDYTIVIDHLAYSRRIEGVFIASGEDVTMRVELATQPVALDPITVTVESRGVERALAMGGEVIEAEEVERVRQRSRDLGDLFQLLRHKGLMVKRQGGDVCVGFLVGQVRMNKGPCHPAMVYIDGQKMVDPWSTFTMPAEMVENIVLFRPVDAGRDPLPA